MSRVTKPDTYTYEKNRRYEVKAGTRCAFVSMDIPTRAPNVKNNLFTRSFFAAQVAQRAAELWSIKWGPVPWDLASVLISHTTLGVIAEFRVEKE